jgi:hypothetical protein
VVAALISISPRRSSSEARTMSSRIASGTPRKKLCCPGGGPFVASMRRSAEMNAASSVAALLASSRRSMAAFSPSNHGEIDQSYG